MKQKKRILDPEYDRWCRKYPHFPGVAKCVELLHSTNVRGLWIDIICDELLLNAHDHADELIAATRAGVEQGSTILLHVLADAKLPEALPLFAELLRSPDESLRHYGVAGLKQLDSKEARRLLWEYDEGASEMA